MLNKASFLAVAAIASLGLAAASPAHAGGSGGDKKNFQIFSKSGNGSHNIFNKPGNSSQNNSSSNSSHNTASSSSNGKHSDNGCCKGDHHHRHHRRHHDKVIVITKYPSYPYRPHVAPVQAPTYVAPRVVPAPAPTCLTKEYLQQSTVMFKDTCTKEWAMSTSTLPAQPVNQACLKKEYPQTGVVLFRDTCTNEWARNPEQQAQGSETSQPR